MMQNKKWIGGFLAFVAISFFALPVLAEGGGGHWSLLTYFPTAFEENLKQMMGKTWINGDDVAHVEHVFMAGVVALLAIGMAVAASSRLRDPEKAVVPEAKLSAATFFELICGGALSMMEKMMGREKARDTFPVVGALAIFILFGNLLGMIPGFLPATDSLRTTAALGITVFLLTHYFGLKYNGMAYLKHFCGPLWWLAPLMLPIELISHIVRPASLALRLFGNMFGDHKVLGIFLGFNILFVPLPVMALGMMVCVVQALVFCLLTMVYFSMAVEDLSHH
jgi:F-type H+-transporting ATPase subunit a